MKVTESGRIAAIAVLLDIPRNTLAFAVERKEIPTVTDATGAKMVRLSDARRWKRTPRKRGRPRLF